MLLETLWLAFQTALVLSTICVAYMLVSFLYNEPTMWRNYQIGLSYPQLKGPPILGNILHIVKPREELWKLLRWFSRQLGGRYVVRVFGLSFFQIAEPQSVEVVLSSSKNTSKGRVYDFLHPWLGQGLLTSQGALWHSRRKLLTPAFHFRILDQFAEHLQQHAVALVDELDGARLRAKQAPVDVAPIISRATLRAIMVTAMGKVDFHTSAGSDAAATEQSYFEAVHRTGTSVVLRLIRPWLWLPAMFRLTSMYATLRKDLSVLHGFTSQVVAERKKELSLKRENSATGLEATENASAKKKSRIQPFLDVLLNAQRDGADLSDKDIREEVDTFMFEGHDTTSLALGWSLELLGRNTEIQDRLAAELETVGGDWETVSKLPYLDRVLKECLRLRPSVHFISRQLDQDAVLPDGMILPVNGTINVLIYDLHRHPDHFPDPERFDPDRFLPEAEQARHPFAYIPFSAGPRNCIGKRFAVMEMKLLLAAVVRRFRIRSAMGEVEDMFVADIVLRPRDGVLLHLAPRRRSGAHELH